MPYVEIVRAGVTMRVPRPDFTPILIPKIPQVTPRAILEKKIEAANRETEARRANRSKGIRLGAPPLRLPPDIKAIQSAAMEVWGVPGPAFYGKSRPEPTVSCRIASMKLCEEMTGHSTVQIGRAHGRDHSTIIQNRRAYARRIDTEPDFRAKVEAVRAAVKAKGIA